MRCLRPKVFAATAAIVGLMMPSALVAQQPEIATAIAFTEGPTVDREGNVYFTELVAQRIMKLSATGVLSTFREKATMPTACSLILKGGW